MKTTKYPIMIAGGLLVLAAGALAHGGKSHAEGQEHESAAAETAVISSHDGMTAIYAHLAAIKTELDSSRLEGIHGHALSIDSAAKDLDKDAHLDAARKKRVQGYVKNVAKLGDAMHDAADGKDLEGTRKAYGKLSAQVDLLDKQFAHPHKPGAANSGAGRREAKE